MSGLDYFELYEKAYAWQGVEAANADWLRNMDWSGIPGAWHLFYFLHRIF
jgi:hypothetical protein